MKAFLNSWSSIFQNPPPAKAGSTKALLRTAFQDYDVILEIKTERELVMITSFEVPLNVTLLVKCGNLRGFRGHEKPFSIQVTSFKTEGDRYLYCGKFIKPVDFQKEFLDLVEESDSAG